MLELLVWIVQVWKEAMGEWSTLVLRQHVRGWTRRLEECFRIGALRLSEAVAWGDRG